MKVPSKETVEKLKTVTISVLITGIVAFIGGAMYAQKINTHIASKAQALSAQAEKQQAPLKQ